MADFFVIYRDLADLIDTYLIELVVFPDHVGKVIPVAFGVPIFKKFVVPGVGVFDPTGMFNRTPIQLGAGSDFLAVGTTIK